MDLVERPAELLTKRPGRRKGDIGGGKPPFALLAFQDRQIVLDQRAGDDDRDITVERDAATAGDHRAVFSAVKLRVVVRKVVRQ